MIIEFIEKSQIEGFSIPLFLSVYYKRSFLTILSGILLQTICILGLQSFIFFIKLLILMRNPKSKDSVPLFFEGVVKIKSPSKNEQTNNIFEISNLQKFSTMVPNEPC